MNEARKRITLVDVVLERTDSMLFEGRRVKVPNDAANIIRDFIGDSDREKFGMLCLNVKNEPTAIQVVHTGSFVHCNSMCLKYRVIMNGKPHYIKVEFSELTG